MSETNLYIKKEFRELVNLLNTGNKLPNEKTEVYFYIDNSDPKELKLIDKNQKHLLCFRRQFNWVPSKTTQFIELSVYLSKLLKKQNILDSQLLTELIRNSIFKIVD